MAESTLALKQDDLRRCAAVALDFGTLPSKWDSEQLVFIDEVIADGLRDFYMPSVGGAKERYEWSFLCVTGSLSLVNADFDYDLPDNFGGLVRRFVLTSGTTSAAILDVVDLDKILHLQNKEPLTGVPRYAAVRVKSVTATTSVSQRWEVLFYPTPNASYTCKFEYPALPDMPSGNSYLLGGAQHANTIKAMVRAAAERLTRPDEKRHFEEAQKSLAASIEYDREVKKKNDATWATTEPTYGTFQWLQRELGGAEFGWNVSTWSHQQLQRIGSIINRGYRHFVTLQNLPVPEGQRARDPHVWSFRTPVTTLSVVTDDFDYDMPSDFVAIIGGVTLGNGTSTKQIRRIEEDNLRACMATADTVGIPKWYATRAKIETNTSAQVVELLLYPRPSQAMTASFKYLRAPTDLSETNKFPMGGSEHAETLLAACKMVMAEGTEQYPRAVESFMRLVYTSIHSDSQVVKADEKTRVITTPTRGSYEWFQQELGIVAEFGPDYTSWSTTQDRIIHSAICRGLCQFYSPPPTGKKFQRSHRWRFLTPSSVLVTSAPYSTGTVEVNDNVVILTSGTWPTWAADGRIEVGGSFYDIYSRQSSTQLVLRESGVSVAAGATYTLTRPYHTMDSSLRSVDGDFIYQPGQSTSGTVMLTDFSSLQERESFYDSSGSPVVAAFVPEEFIGDTKPTKRLLLWPTPDASYRLNYKQVLFPADLEPGDFPLGPEQHYETMLASCAAMISQKQMERFMLLLESSIDHDNRDNNQHLGQNSDLSDVECELPRRRWPYNSDPVVYSQ